MVKNRTVSASALHTPRSTALTTKSQVGTKEVPSWEGIQGWVLSYDKKSIRSNPMCRNFKVAVVEL